ncbi:SLC45 family MFS transporter [Algibacter amylolyticus]|uniref:SLC45 family MFS transporter n=1 Tax=Algibacter amylolyticus TaxID=1608400 RepID=A0A5M7BKV6_9FLAO|nr:MFS transporter [Algibacter amylolyticus]KAA5828014.1 SLC45 family MFS transporter [Algibacter amylolyticus]MBB5267257.1 maltose/moltooligosaccharide transporter [Algibacter amylolyticus]TSJ82259.1 SLC45 family MFS transporter [Algibacter amylolyticus]
MEKRRLSFWQIWNMSFGFLGIQMGFALQNANASRILQIFGADVHELSWFWIIAPLMGLIVQPIIGHYSDKTWGRFGRRKPYFLVGAILASVGLVLMPQADIFIAFLPALWVGAGMLMIMDASFNIAMEPFRALVGDNLRTDQRTLGFSVQTALIGFGAVIGSWLPYALTNWFGISNETIQGAVPFNLILSFIIGAIILVVSILITVVTTKEYSPEELDSFEDEHAHADAIDNHEKEKSSLWDIFEDFKKMPTTMRQLSWVQFFSWFGLFGMWVFATPAIAQHIYGLPFTDSSSSTYQNAGDWVGILFGVYNLVSAFYAFALPYIAKQIGRKKTHSISLIIGGLALLSIYIMPNENWLIVSMIGVGIAWASILAMPYAILAGSISPKKMGVYMGIFNFFIVIPQIINALIGGPLVKYAYGNQAIFALMMSGVSFLIAASLVYKVKDVDDIIQS